MNNQEYMDKQHSLFERNINEAMDNFNEMLGGVKSEEEHLALDVMSAIKGYFTEYRIDHEQYEILKKIGIMK